MGMTYAEKLAYQRGYNRAATRSRDRAGRALKIAKRYRALMDCKNRQPRCANCFRWVRGGANCLWGHCAGDFKFEAGEGSMWADTFAGEPRRQVCTHENFGCVNWLPRSPSTTEDRE
jgi:hypothetical protein